MLSGKQKKLGVSTGITLGVLVACTWGYFEFWGLENRPFTLIKDWQHNENDFTNFSEDAQWVHLQCHEPMMKLSPLGNPIALGAKVASQKDAKTWVMTIQPAAKFSDGTAVAAEHFVNAWEFRKTAVKNPTFRRISNVKAIDAAHIEVTLDGSSNPDFIRETVTSMWITPLKNTKGTWSWSAEISGPCEGPFVPSVAAFDTLNLKRNKYWYDFEKSQIRKISVISGLGSRGKAAEMFQQGSLTYVDATVDPDLKSDFTGKRNSFPEPAAWYLIINQGTAVAKKLTPFIHHVINRGELESVVTNGRFFKVMYGIVPLSFVDDSGQPVYGPFAQSAVESLIEARKDFGIPISTSVTEIKSPFGRPLRIYSPEDDKISPILRRFAERLKSNFNIEAEIIRDVTDDAKKNSIDLAFIEIPLERDLTKWAQSMLEQYESVFPMPKDVTAKFKLLADIASQSAVIDKQREIILNLDAVPYEKNSIVPLGQFASAYLLSPQITGVEVRGDSRQDPDVRRAKWVALNK